MHDLAGDRHVTDPCEAHPLDVPDYRNSRLFGLHDSQSHIDLTRDYIVTYTFPNMDAVFKALADPTRRGLLDELFKQDGQTLGALEQRLPMTRFGVMKHLKVLEQAGLVTTRRRGREKLHFLNPVPIRLIHDRWVSKYAERWVAGLSELKHDLEGEQ